ncbi:MAG: tRNA dihydrouridine synthase DusB [Clostridia bacterium]|nr:tRNA dihydrouridine synthase DusB [Clostridia bacterium]
MKIGNLEIKGQAILAPMAGATDKTFRKICSDFGSAYTITEMVSSKAIMFNQKNTRELMDLSGDNHPVAIQLFGDDPFTMAKAAERAMEFGPDMIDINMGCPVPKIAGNGCGSALMKRPDLCGNIVRAMKQAVDIPITVKIRKGWDNDSVNAVEVAKICEDAGADAIAVHGRTRTQMYEPPADWEIIRLVKEAVKVPVIGNGDILGANSAAMMIDRTGCDAVMVGRAALGNPWIFREINACLRDELRIMPPPSIEERILVIRKHIGSMCEAKGEERGMKEARKHVGWYMHGLRNAAEFRRRAGYLSTIQELDELMRDVYIANKTVEEDD